MLLARLVTGRYGHEAVEEQPRPPMSASGQGWFARLVAAISIRKRVR
jgi:hypothetical protein